MENFKKHVIKNPETIKGGGRLAYWLGYIAGKAIGGMATAGEGLERSGFNGAGANK